MWDFPRPPALEHDDREVVVVLGGQEVCRTTSSLLVLETSHPPGFYLPREHWTPGSLRSAQGTSFCEWKGVASYFDVVGGDRIVERAAWTYPSPVPAWAALAGHVAVYPAAMDLITVGGETVRAQDGGFYGGWVTDDVVGPFKGGSGSTFW